MPDSHPGRTSRWIRPGIRRSRPGAPGRASADAPRGRRRIPCRSPTVERPASRWSAGCRRRSSPREPGSTSRLRRPSRRGDEHRECQSEPQQNSAGQSAAGYMDEPHRTLPCRPASGQEHVTTSTSTQVSGRARCGHAPASALWMRPTPRRSARSRASRRTCRRLRRCPPRAFASP